VAVAVIQDLLGSDHFKALDRFKTDLKVILLLEIQRF
jgi:hypothetical protein